MLVFVEFCRILVIEACEAEVVAVAGCEHSFVREEGEGVGADHLAYFIDIMGVTDELLWCVDVHSVVASVLERGTCNTYVYL